MPLSTSQEFQKAAFDTLLWLLDPVREKADQAYLLLFKKLVTFLRYRRATDPEVLAEQTLARVAEAVYLRLTGLKREEAERAHRVHEVPLEILREVYERERDGLPRLALTFARHATQEFYGRRRPSLQYALEAPLLRDESVDGSAIAEERLRLLEQTLAGLPAEDRRLIERYYDFVEKDQGKTRGDLAKELGMTANVLRTRVARIRQRLRAEIMAGEEPAQAQFTAYYAPSVAPQSWNTILAYMHVASASALVHADSKRRLGDTDRGTDKKTATRKVRIARGTQILVVPQSEALEFNPPQVGFAWLEDYHCAEFRCRVRNAADADKNRCNAAITVAFYVAPILVAEISFTVSLGSATRPDDHTCSTTVHPYQRVFVSYSHHDSGIADQLEKAYRALGIEYLRDVRMLRSGEEWAPALLQRIDESEVFQLLWSKAAKRSAYVRQEWRHALGLHRRFFIRPVYWDKPMPPPPRELADIHFAYLEL